MKLNQLYLIQEGIERIVAAVTDTDATEIIEALIGLAWDDEDAGIIQRFMIDTPEDDSRRGKQPKVNDLIERLQKSAEHVRSTSKGGMEYEARLMEEAAAALESARAEVDALRAELEQLKIYYKNGIDCFAEPCERHSGEKAPPFSEFFEKYGGQCLICVVDNNKALQAENEQLRQDAERYRWLRKGESDDVAVVRGLGAMDYGSSAVAYTYSEEIDGDDLDAAIDAAMSKEGK